MTKEIITWWTPKFKLWDKVKFIPESWYATFFWDTELTIWNIDVYRAYDDDWVIIEWKFDINYDLNYKIWDKEDVIFSIPENALILKE